ncbi:hypothetical protein F5Y04DRAFT_258104 [Hypomontagnella monticulosa]|nr:hypothetical protein F5Y04DRAFT_258104 [Hypomontagnella monticulosa]
MAASKVIPCERLPVLQQIYDTLCLYLGFYDDEKHLVRQILDGDFIKPFFKEYQHDYLEVTLDLEDIDCDELFRWCRSANTFVSPKYTSSAAPNKGEWTVLDHAARFVVRVLRFSWVNDGAWTRGKFDPDDDPELETDKEFHQVWAILRYLQAEWEAVNIEEWEATGLNESFTTMLTGRL